MIVKENRNTMLDDPSSGREADPFAFGSKEVYHLNVAKRENHHTAFEVKGRDEYQNPKFVDGFYLDDENGMVKEDQNGRLYHPSSLGLDTDSLSSGVNANDKVNNSLEHKCSMTVEGFTRVHETALGNSRPAYVAATDLLDTVTDLYTDKNMLEFEPPEIIVCCKETNHIVKDVCIDEGIPVQGKISIGSNKDDQSSQSLPRPLYGDSHSENTDVLAASSLDNAKGVGPDEHENQKESDGKLLDQENQKSPLVSYSAKGTVDHCNPEESMQKGKINSCATGNNVTDASEEDSFVDRRLPIQEFGTRSFLRSLLNSLDGEGNKISSGKAASEGPASSSAESGQKQDVQASTLHYNSKVESGSITFNFNSLAPVVPSVAKGRTEDVEDETVDLVDVLNHKDKDADNLSDAKQTHFSCSNVTSTGKVHKPSLNRNDGFCNESKETSEENVHVEFTNQKQENSICLSSDGHLQFPSSRSTNSIKSDDQAVDSRVSKHERRDSGSDLVVSQGRYDMGELSFSAASFVNYSGPIAFSGSLSLHSDGSGASAGSFAFPILQSEWNNSPVKADGRHFRKQKGWRSGLFCCRF